MSKKDFSNRMSTGMILGLVLPLIVFLLVFAFTSKDQSMGDYFARILRRDLLTHYMSICVFPNVFAFLIFNRLDKLYSSRGVLGITIIWALTVLLIKMV